MTRPCIGAHFFISLWNNTLVQTTWWGFWRSLWANGTAGSRACSHPEIFPHAFRGQHLLAISGLSFQPNWQFRDCMVVPNLHFDLGIEPRLTQNWKPFASSGLQCHPNMTEKCQTPAVWAGMSHSNPHVIQISLACAWLSQLKGSDFILPNSETVTRSMVFIGLVKLINVMTSMLLLLSSLPHWE